MRFLFNDEQREFQESVHGFLAKACTAADVRALWDDETGRSSERWAKLAELGILGLLVPEDLGGLGLDETDFVLLLEETGRAALPEPVVESAAVGAPLLRDLPARELAARWLPAVADGTAIVTVGHPVNPYVSDAHVADLLLLAADGELHAVERRDVRCVRRPSTDGSRRLFEVGWTPRTATCVARGDAAGQLLAAAFDRGALASAAQQLGVAQQLIDQAVRYAGTREQFGRPIGSFQAIKHMLASAAVRLTFARPVVYRAAFSVAHAVPSRALDVSHAKAAASEAALAAARTALQVHGAIGYTWEVDLHLWMKRAWSLEAAWGTRVWHRARIAEALLDGDAPAPTFGFESRA